ncbi:MAG TPA: hypothetical protein VHI10_15010 [Mycobacterium sp.]|nr:hypothetical protein [Mycobacterium sp.]
MDSGSHRESGLSKSVWSDADFDQMGWHDATVHGLAVHTDEEAETFLSRLLLDLDYIVRWVHPVPPEKYFTFWVSPATLVFDGVWDLEGDIGCAGLVPSLEIVDLHRSLSDDGRHDQPLWHIEGLRFDLKFRASGYAQYLRQPPVLIPGQSLSVAERGGFAFTEFGFT